MSGLWNKEPIVAAFDSLMKAHAYAQDVGQTSWDFALDIEELGQLGVNSTDLLWLIQKGMLEHAHETTQFGDDRRSFDRDTGLSFSDRSCFVLTKAGIDRGSQIASGVSRPNDDACTESPLGRRMNGFDSISQLNRGISRRLTPPAAKVQRQFRSLVDACIRAHKSGRGFPLFSACSQFSFCL